MKTYGKPLMKDGVLYYHIRPWWQRWLYKITKVAQRFLWRIGVNCHDLIFDECVPDFKCCVAFVEVDK